MFPPDLTAEQCQRDIQAFLRLYVSLGLLKLHESHVVESEYLSRPVAFAPPVLRYQQDTQASRGWCVSLAPPTVLPFDADPPFCFVQLQILVQPSTYLHLPVLNVPPTSQYRRDTSKFHLSALDVFLFFHSCTCLILRGHLLIYLYSHSTDHLI